MRPISEKQRELAESLFVTEGKSSRQIAGLLGVGKGSVQRESAAHAQAMRERRCAAGQSEPKIVHSASPIYNPRRALVQARQADRVWQLSWRVRPVPFCAPHRAEALGRSEWRAREESNPRPAD
jgi:hypothetical protein